MEILATVITVDGPSGVGKSTLCKSIAKILKWNLLDSGIIYRVLALSALYHQVNLTCEKALVLLAINLDVHFIFIHDNFHVILDGKDVSDKIRTQKIANIASQIATFPYVRQSLLFRQRAFRKSPGLVADGRDMGTVVFPDAAVKIFLDAALEERANRRMLQFKKNGFNIDFRYFLSKLKERDERDLNRSVSPLLYNKDALFLDSTGLTIDQVIRKALQYTYWKLGII